MTKNVKVLKEGSQDVWCTSLLISFLLGTKMIKKLKKTNVYLQHKSTVCNSEVRGGGIRCMHNVMQKNNPINR